MPHPQQAFVYTYVCCNLAPPHSTNQSTHMPTDAATLSSMTQPQPWFTCSPIGAAVQQRSAHSFHTRPSPSRESCTFQGILWSRLSLDNKCCNKAQPFSTYPGSCMWQLMQRPGLTRLSPKSKSQTGQWLLQSCLTWFTPSPRSCSHQWEHCSASPSLGYCVFRWVLHHSLGWPVLPLHLPVGAAA